MKRYAAIFLSILLLAAMTACASTSRPDTGTEPPTEGTSEPASPDTLPDEQPSEQPDAQTPELAERYDELVERFYALVVDPYGFTDIAEYGELGVIESARSAGDGALDALGYTIEDLSGDGVPELVVGTLPEFGGQTNAVYTLVDGQPQFVLEGWYRSSYVYMGDGHFSYCAAEGGQGVFYLTKDGTALECESFLFTSLNRDGDLDVYYNETGSWDTAESEKSDMTAEEFWALDPAGSGLPLTSFHDYTASQSGGINALNDMPVRVQWGELQVPGLTDYEKFVADDGEYSAEVLFTTERTVADFELVALTIGEVYDDGTVSYLTEPLYSMDVLTPERPLVVRMSFPGDLPAYGISYTDEDGAIHRLTLEISGEDGTLLLTETK